VPRMTAKRKAACVRDSHGRFKVWKGGAKLQDLPKQENNFHGIATHIGKEFSRQHGRPARVGDVVRFKTAEAPSTSRRNGTSEQRTDGGRPATMGRVSPLE
jgi:hypothetical protein